MAPDDQQLLDELDQAGDDPEAEALKLGELVRRAEAVQNGTGEFIDVDEAGRRVIARLRDIRSEGAAGGRTVPCWRPRRTPR